MPLTAIVSLERQTSVLRLLLLAVVALSPLPFGSVEPWAVLTFELAAAGLGVLALLIVFEEPGALPRPARRLLLLAGVVLAVGVLQLLPDPGEWAGWLSTPASEARRQIARLAVGGPAPLAPYSLEAAATLDALIRFVAYVFVGLAAAVAVRRPSHLVQAVVALAVGGAFQGLYGAAEYLSGHQHIFAYAKASHVDEASGTFINRNHFAAYLAMVLPLAVGLALEGRRRLPAARTWRERALWMTLPAGHLMVGGGVAAALVWTGVLLSYSRTGLAATLAGVGFLVLTRGRWRQTWLVTGLLLLPTTWLLWQDVRAPGARLFAGRQELTSLHGRLPVWQEAGEMALDFLPLGTGFGTFEGAFSLYRPGPLDHRFRHVHNDWLQSAVEGGPVVTLAFLGMLFAATRGTRSRLGASPVRSILPACVVAALLAIALDSLADFSLRIPAVAALTAALAGLSCSPGAAVRVAADQGTAVRFPSRVGAAA